ncbi:ABC1 kinase family protein [Rhodocaloribacter sp.]
MHRTSSLQHRRRVRRIIGTLARHGLGWLVLELGLGGLLPFHRGLLHHPRRTRPYTQPEHLRMALEELGVTFIKLGQILSTRPDLLPPDYVTEFTRLQDHAPPIPYEQVAAVIEEELGRPPDEVFRAFERTPMASASIGQVHAAVLDDGARVVVKVQRPGVEALAEQDLAILLDLAHRAQERTAWGRAYDLESWVHEFAFSLRNEFNYSVEAANAEQFRRNFAGDSSLHIPVVHGSYSTRRVLTMERLEGYKITDIDALKRAGIDCERLARESTRLMLTMMFEHGFFHADPHPGNLFVLPGGVIGLIDFGMVGQLDAAVRDTLLRIALALIARDADRLVDELSALGIAPGRVQRYALKQDLQHLIRRYANRPLKDIAAAPAFHDLMDVARRHRLQLPADLVLMAKVMAMSEGTALRLAPDFQVLQFAQPYVRRFWLHKLSPRAQARRFKEGMLDLADVGAALPRQMRRLLKQIEQGTLPLRVTVDPPPEVFRQLNRAANRIAFSVLTAALIIGAGLLTLVYHPRGAHGFFVLTLAVSMLLGFGVLWSVWRSGRF